jgi:tetratricopeptide (TPR) repeat protein
VTDSAFSIKIAERCYRLGLVAAKRRNLRDAIDYAGLACAMDPSHDGAARLAEICSYELEEVEDAEEQALERLLSLVTQKKWKAAAEEAKRLPCQNVLLLNIQGCLWALAKQYDSAIDCFAGALAKDRGNLLAANALVELSRRRKSFWSFFVSR